MSTGYLDYLCHEYIIKNNAVPAPLNYRGFPKSTCISVNHVVCHGIPGDKTLDEGDILNIDQIEEISCLKSQFNLVISDLAPNLTGIKTVDEEKIFELNTATLKIAVSYLKKGNTSFIIKTFQNSLLNPPKDSRLNMRLLYKLFCLFAF